MSPTDTHPPSPMSALHADARSNPDKYRTALIFADGVTSTMLATGIQVQGCPVYFCFSDRKNIVGSYLSWMEFEAPDGPYRVFVLPDSTRRAAEATATARKHLFERDYHAGNLTELETPNG